MKTNRNPTTTFHTKTSTENEIRITKNFLQNFAFAIQG